MLINIYFINVYLIVIDWLTKQFEYLITEWYYIYKYYKNNNIIIYLQY